MEYTDNAMTKIRRDLSEHDGRFVYLTLQDIHEPDVQERRGMDRLQIPALDRFDLLQIDLSLMKPFDFIGSTKSAHCRYSLIADTDASRYCFASPIQDIGLEMESGRRGDPFGTDRSLGPSDAIRPARK